ncbi:hypothetical protein DSCO28_65790 [Desulfosarcina ovata subsp. sediminis]|uniref:Peptidase C14 caspase domain-containing protein n=1 Tax=Desulfosarcina ovata subsp. sediminis TaxID=885957 RepID=A0A5K8A0H7_9BACT|nr:caspase family protein [Desulfosarcina ovata]BBO86013.1 hypothetical protein DSCO28_65790 [Desulfosarcina ovata subsp. sediminis]
MSLFIGVGTRTRRFLFCCLTTLALLMTAMGCNTVSTKPQLPAVGASIDNAANTRTIDSASSRTITPEYTVETSAPEPPPSSTVSSYRSPIPTDTITLLFRKEEDKAPKRLDPTSLAATAALERALLQRNYKIPPVSPDLLRKLDRSPNVVVCFAPDAGFSMTYAIQKSLRPDPGVNTYAAEVAIRARVFVGAGMLSVEEGRGTIRFSGNGQQRDYGERRAMELAAERAANSLVKRVVARLKSLTPIQIWEYADLQFDQATITGDEVLPPPSGEAPLPSPAQVHVLVIGVSDYRNASRLNHANYHNLNGVTVDMQNIANTFAELGIARNRINLLKDRDATAANVRAGIDAMARTAGPDDLLVLYISGHGMQANFKKEGMSLPVLYDFSMQNRESAPDFTELLERMTQSAADRFVMIVDTCHSGGAVSDLTTVVLSSQGAQLSKTKGAPSPGMVIRALDTTRNIAVLAASRLKEYSLETADGGGLFTKHLVKGLKSAHENEVLRDIVEKRVAEPVISTSREECNKHPGKCPTGQQTPVFGFSGGGDMICL